MNLGQAGWRGLPLPAAGTFPRCPGLPRSAGPPALVQSVSSGHKINHSALPAGQVPCQFGQNLPQNLQPGKARAQPAQGWVCEAGIHVSCNCTLEDCRGHPAEHFYTRPPRRRPSCRWPHLAVTAAWPPALTLAKSPPVLKAQCRHRSLCDICSGLRFPCQEQCPFSLGSRCPS